MQINRKCGWACVNYHLSALKPLRSFGPTQRGPTLVQDVPAFVTMENLAHPTY